MGPVGLSYWGIVGIYMITCAMLYQEGSATQLQRLTCDRGRGGKRGKERARKGKKLVEEEQRQRQRITLGMRYREVQERKERDGSCSVQQEIAKRAITKAGRKYSSSWRYATNRRGVNQERISVKEGEDK